MYPPFKSDYVTNQFLRPTGVTEKRGRTETILSPINLDVMLVVLAQSTFSYHN